MAATLYPGIGAIEGTNLSVGRGTDTPFEQIGAPWIDGAALAAALNARALPGVRFYPVTFTPAAGAKLGGQACHGVFLIVTDRDRLRPVRVGLEIASALATAVRRRSSGWRTPRCCSDRSAMLAKIRAGEDPAAIAASWSAGEEQWRLTAGEISALLNWGIGKSGHWKSGHWTIAAIPIGQLPDYPTIQFRLTSLAGTAARRRARRSPNVQPDRKRPARDARCLS